MASFPHYIKISLVLVWFFGLLGLLSNTTIDCEYICIDEWKFIGHPLTQLTTVLKLLLLRLLVRWVILVLQ